MWDGSTLACDSLVTEGSSRAGYMNKIIKLDNGGYLAGCGDAVGPQIIADWMNGKAPAPLDKQLENTQAIFVDPEGKAYLFEGTVASRIECDWKEAIGSGADFARAAIDMGADAVKAVQMGIKRDVFSGGKIYSVTVDKKKEPRKARKTKQLQQELVQVDTPIDNT